MGKGKILLTGAAGYIASHTWVELSQSGYDVVGVDNFYNSERDVIDRIGKIIGKPVNFEEADCSDFESFKKVFEKNPDIVGAVHFAAYKAVGESIEKPLDYYRNNLTSLLNLITLIREKGKRANIVFSSSCTVYGQPDKDHLPIAEDAPLKRSLSPYGKSKQMKVHVHWAWTIRACFREWSLGGTRMLISIEWFRLFILPYAKNIFKNYIHSDNGTFCFCVM